MSDTQQLLASTDSASASPTDDATVVKTSGASLPPAGPSAAGVGLKKSFNRNLATLVVTRQAQLDPNVIVQGAPR